MQHTLTCYEKLKDGIQEEKQQNRDPDQEHDFSYILTNKDVLNICTVEAVSNYVNVQQAKYLAHLARHKILLFNDNNNIKRGRPMLTVEQQILNSMNMTADEFYRQAMKINFNMDTVD